MIHGTGKVKKLHNPLIPPTANTAGMAAIFHLFFQAILLSMCQIEAMTLYWPDEFGFFSSQKKKQLYGGI
jgi:hypothetical protein